MSAASAVAAVLAHDAAPPGAVAGIASEAGRTVSASGAASSDGSAVVIPSVKPAFLQ